jgi:uncharacterized protein
MVQVSDVTRRSIEAIQADDRLYPLHLGDRYLLFRIDGFINRISKPLYDLLHGYQALPLEERLARIEAESGSTEALREEVSALAELTVDDTVPEYIPLERVGRKSLGGILLMITQTCNLACLYCYAGGGSYGQPTKFQSTDNALTIIDHLIERSGKRKVLRITFFGGEPLMNVPLIERIVAYCEQKAQETGKVFAYSLTTNGLLVTPEIAAFLKQHRFTVMVSFDGVKTYHDKYRPTVEGGGSFDAVKQGVRTLIDGGVGVQLRATVVREMVSKAFVDEAVSEAKALGVNRLNLTSVDCLRSDDNEMELRRAEYEVLNRVYRSVTDENIASASSEPVRFDPYGPMIKALATGKAVGLGRCGACNAMSAVSTDGRIYPCHRFVGMDDYQIGHVSSGGPDPEKVEEFFAKATAATYPKCRQCIARLICGGHCFFTVADAHGGFRPPSDGECENVRSGLLTAINYLMQLEEGPRQTAAAYLKRL